MPRKLRVEYPGAMYHVMSRGDRREKIFLNDVDRQDFVKTLAEACQKTNWQVHAYCLMPNHYHLVFEQWMERRRLEETDPEDLKALRRGWCLGSEGFRRELLLRMEGKLGQHHSGELHRASAEAKAERIIAEELQRQGWHEADLVGRRKSDIIKLEIAARLRRETTLSTKAIAARVHLGSAKAANRSLHHYMGRGAAASVGQGQLAI